MYISYQIITHIQRFLYWNIYVYFLFLHGEIILILTHKNNENNNENSSENNNENEKSNENENRIVT